MKTNAEKKENKDIVIKTVDNENEVRMSNKGQVTTSLYWFSIFCQTRQFPRKISRVWQDAKLVRSANRQR